MAEPDAQDLRTSQSLEGFCALVTGASSGLGARFARLLAVAGAQVVVTARRGDRLEALRAEFPDKVVPVPCDLGEDAERVRMMDQAAERLGGLDILVNNAGVGDPAPAESESLHEFRRAVEINLVAPFHLAQMAATSMFVRGGGSIVNISSMYGIVAAAPIKHAAYCASKGALISLTRELACQWADRNVRVNALAPGWFESEMTAGMWLDDKSVEYVRRGTPLRRRGRADELDAALLLLAGRGGSFITGQTLVVDGGWTAR